MSSTHTISFSSIYCHGKEQPLHPLGRELRRFIFREIERANQDPGVKSILLVGNAPSSTIASAPRHFSAGADLTEFASFEKGEGGVDLPGNDISLIDVVQAIENSSKPVVAAIEGACLGGGLEVALACHYRVCVRSAKLGLPEVHVGVIPGAGGTQRLPKLVGLQQALTMILTGAPVSGPTAEKIGLVDFCVSKDSEIFNKALQYASFAEVMPLQQRRVGLARPREAAPQSHAMLHTASLSIPSNGGDGLRAALEAIRAACFLPLEEGMKIEREQFIKTLISPQGKARRHAFFAERKAQKMVASPEKSNILVNKQSGVPVAVIGAGTMGSGIAIVLLMAGFHVTLVDVSENALQKGVALIHSTFDSRVKKKKMAVDQAESMKRNFEWTQKMESLVNCALVVEAVVENMRIKQQIFSQLDKILPESSILLSNTSTLDIDQMASVLSKSRQALFAGWHFFSPAHVMKLVEIVVGTKTSSSTVSLLQVLTKKIRKIGVVVGNCDGFCGNRLLKPYSAETCMLLVEGHASIERVDAALANYFGMALGPFQLGDLAGNDVGFYIRVERGHARKSLQDPIVPPKRPSRYTELADVMVSEYGRMGQKVGKGWYDYDPNIGGGRIGLPSREMKQLVESHMIGTQQHNAQALSDEEIVEHALFPLVNEGFKCLEEGIVRCPSDIDIVYLYGYGWPVWRGGPMYWADFEVGLPRLLDWLRERAHLADYFVPSMLLQRCVELRCTVTEYYEQGLSKKAQLSLSKL